MNQQEFLVYLQELLDDVEKDLNEKYNLRISDLEEHQAELIELLEILVNKG